METTEVRNIRLRWTRCIKYYGRDDPRTEAAAIELAEARADAAEAEARRLRALAEAARDVGLCSGCDLILTVDDQWPCRGAHCTVEIVGAVAS